MTEQIIHSLMLAFHNIALVGCAAAPFYNRNLVKTRSQYGPKLHYELDKVVEETLQGNAPYCMVFLTVLFITGIGMPLNHYYFHNTFRELHVIGWSALFLKLVSIFGMMVIMGKIFFGLNPRLKELFGSFSPGYSINSEHEKEFFQKRAKRKALCEKCLVLAIIVLICSAFIGIGV